MSAGTFFAGALPGGTSGFVGGSTLSAWGLQFDVTSACQINGYWWYVPAGADPTGSDYSAELFSTADGSSGTAVSGSSATGSGTWTAAAWNYISLGSPVALESGTTYVAVVYQAAAGSIQYAHNYWSTGGGASGIVTALATAPGAAAALNAAQQPYANPATIGQFPATVNQASFYGLDVALFSASPPAVSPSGLLLAGLI